MQSPQIWLPILRGLEKYFRLHGFLWNFISIEIKAVFLCPPTCRLCPGRWWSPQTAWRWIKSSHSSPDIESPQSWQIAVPGDWLGSIWRSSSRIQEQTYAWQAVRSDFVQHPYERTTQFGTHHWVRIFRIERWSVSIPTVILMDFSNWTEATSAIHPTSLKSQWTTASNWVATNVYNAEVPASTAKFFLLHWKK